MSRIIKVIVHRKPWSKQDVIKFSRMVFIEDPTIPYGAYLRGIAKEMKSRLMKVAGKGKGIGVCFENSTI